MAELIIATDFHTSYEALTAGDRAVGSWVRMAAWSVKWGEGGTPALISRHSRRLFGVTKPVERALIQVGLLAEQGDLWRIEGEGDLWRQTVPARSKIPDALRQFIYERDGHKCVLCGAVDNLSLDHIQPWSKGGKDTEDNLRVLCRSCNSSRGNRTDD